MSHRTKYAVEFQRAWIDPRDHSRATARAVFKCWADSGKAAVGECIKIRGIKKDQIVAVYEMQDGIRTKIL